MASLSATSSPAAAPRFENDPCALKRFVHALVLFSQARLNTTRPRVRSFPLDGSNMSPFGFSAARRALRIFNVRKCGSENPSDDEDEDEEEEEEESGAWRKHRRRTRRRRRRSMRENGGDVHRRCGIPRCWKMCRRRHEGRRRIGRCRKEDDMRG